MHSSGHYRFRYQLILMTSFLHVHNKKYDDSQDSKHNVISAQLRRTSTSSDLRYQYRCCDM